MSDRILTIEEVAKLMKVGQKTVYRWISARQLPAAKIGYKTYRVFEADIVKFLRKNMTSAQNKITKPKKK